MKYLVILTTLIIMTGPQVSFGRGGDGNGSIAGNGGDVVYCANPQPGQKRIELLDLFESRVLQENAISLGEPAWDYLRRVRFVLDRLSKRDPKRAQIYWQQAQQFIDESEFVSHELPDIPDSKHIAIPKGCEIRQIVIQNPLALPGQKRFQVNNLLWNALDEENRAALVLHEVIYREALAHGHKNSINTRDLNVTLCSEKSIMKSYLSDYFSLLISNEFYEYHFDFSSGNWAVIDLNPRGEYYHNYSRRSIWPILTANFFGQTEQELGSKAQLAFYDAGRTQYLLSLKGEPFLWPLNGKADGKKLRFHEVRLNEKGEIYSGIIAEALIQVGASFSLHCLAYKEVVFGPIVHNCTLDESQANLIEMQGRMVAIKNPHKYYPGGQVQARFGYGTRIDTARFAYAEEFVIRGEKLKFEKEFTLTETGYLREAYLAAPGTVFVPKSGRSITARAGAIEFYEDQSVYKVILENSTYLFDKKKGRSRFVPAGAEVYFDRDGEATIWRE
jgi:hypothetical protein